MPFAHTVDTDVLRTWDGVVGPLLAAGYQTLAASMRGCGNSVFLNPVRPARARPRPWHRMPLTCSTAPAPTA